jgi:excisionase family DNA binding protein
VDQQRLLTVQEAAAFLGCAPSTLYDKVQARAIPYVRLWAGKRKVAIRFTPEILSEHVARSIVRPRHTAA